MPCRIHKHDGVIPAISVQIKTITGFGLKVFEAIRRDKSARFGIVVAAVQVVEPRLFVVVIPAIAERIDREQLRTTLPNDLAPGIVLIRSARAAAFVEDRYDIPLQVLAVYILLSVVFIIT